MLLLKRFPVVILISLGLLISIVITAYAFSPDTDLSDASASFIGESEDDSSGIAVASAGDVNGDGYDDILIGAWQKNAATGNDFGPGKVYLILGKASGWVMDIDLSMADASFLGEEFGDACGQSIASAGDVNGDGYDDILIGAWGNDEAASIAGQAYLILGKASGWTMNTNLSSVDASFIGEERWDNAGRSVASAGDVNGDGYDDILIGASGSDTGGGYSGQAYLILGKASGWVMDTSLSAADASFWGKDTGHSTGHSVASAGDVNRDGYDDILISDYMDEEADENAGQTYLVLGKASGWIMDTSLSTADASFLGEGLKDWSGISIASAGDVNGDGFDDILIGAMWNGEGGNKAGQAYLIFGKSSGWVMNTSLSNADASFIGEDEEDLCGVSVSSAGDVNGDGYYDILIGASGDDDGGGSAGQTYLFLGKASGWTMDTNLSMADASFWGEDANDHSGASVASAGDVNGDSYDDILIGAYFDEEGGENAGQTYLILCNLSSATDGNGSTPEPETAPATNGQPTSPDTNGSTSTTATSSSSDEQPPSSDTSGSTITTEATPAPGEQQPSTGQNYYIYIIIAVLAILIVLFVLFWLRRKRRRREESELSE